MPEQVQLSELTLEERARRDGAEIDVDHVYHEEIAEFHVTRAVALENEEAPEEAGDGP